MKRLHVHIAVDELEQGVHFYSHLFGAEPTTLKDDYAKWQLEDPRVNFAISARGATAGVEHLGLQVDSAEELSQVQSRIAAADAPIDEQIGTACCYARSDKYWTQDPSGVAWEAFHTLDSIPTFNQQEESGEASSCCAPPVEQKSSCC